MTPPDDAPRDEHGERIPDETSERKGLAPLNEFAAIFQGQYERALGRERAEKEHAATCTAEICASCSKAKCIDCGVPSRVYAKRCKPCDDRHSRALMLDRAMVTVPKRFRWVVDSPEKLRERVHPAGIIGAAVKWASELGSSPPSLVLHGPTGAGKSSLAVALFTSWGELPMNPDAMFAPAISIAMAPSGHPLGQGLAPLLERAYTTSLLVLDDVGAEPARLSEVIQAVMHKRYDADLPTWITTGLSEADVAKRYDGGVARRMFEEAKLVKLGESVGG